MTKQHDHNYGPPPPPRVLRDPSVLIDYFDGSPEENPYWFLSNFARTPFDGSVAGFPWRHYETGEAAFQAAKATDEREWLRIASMKDPHEAKNAGRTTTLRGDWDYIKVGVMKDLLAAKFHPLRQPEMCRLLLATGTATLVEKNWWGPDIVWGVDIDTGLGSNLLGTLLTLRREELRLGLVRPEPEVHWATVRHPYRLLEGQQLFDHLVHHHGYYALGHPESEVREQEAHLVAHHVSGPLDGVRRVDPLASSLHPGEWLDLLAASHGVLVMDGDADRKHFTMGIRCTQEQTRMHSVRFPVGRGRYGVAVKVAEAANRLRRNEQRHLAGEDFEEDVWL